MSIEVSNITKTFGSYTALKNVSLKVNDGELLALLGPSGSGKTTLLRIIAGLEVPDDRPDSEILFHERSVVSTSVRSRGVGFVFQHYALFRQMTVFENIAFGLKVRPQSTRPEKREIHDRVQRLLKLIQLEGFGGRYPSQLSGGQRQRVALARALAVEPQVLLLDEPFGALDAKVRQGLRSWLRKLHEEIHLTSILVTHDQEEALEVADRVVVMNQAKIEQIGTPEEVFHNPASQFVMEFLGQVNVFHCRVQDGKPLLGDTPFDICDEKTGGSRTVAYARPHELELRRSLGSEKGVSATVARLNLAGALAKVHLHTQQGHAIQVDMSLAECQALRLSAGEQVFVCPKHVRVFEPDFTI